MLTEKEITELRDVLGDALREDYLLPCPFCGSRNLELSNLVDEDDYFVHCNGCDIQQIANYPKPVAIQRWNTRAK